MNRMDSDSNSSMQELSEAVNNLTANFNDLFKNALKAVGESCEQIPELKNVIVNEESIPDPKELFKAMTGLASRSKPEEEQKEINDAVDKVFDFESGKDLTNNVCELLGKLMGDNSQIEHLKLLMSFQCRTDGEYTQEDVDNLYKLSDAIRNGTLTVKTDVVSPQMQEEFKDIIVGCFANMFSKIAQEIQDKVPAGDLDENSFENL